MKALSIYTGILVMALVTYLIRVLPMVLFSRPVRSPFIQSFLYYVPYAVLAALTFPGVFMGGLPLVASGLGVAAAVVWAACGGSLLGVASVAALVAWLGQWLCLSL